MSPRQLVVGELEDVAAPVSRPHLAQIANSPRPDQDPSNPGADFLPNKTWTRQSGWLYALYHFTSGRWCVGQAVRPLWLGTEEHCGHAKRNKRLTDVLHTALANELSPFSFVVFPLEKITYMDYQANTRE